MRKGYEARFSLQQASQSAKQSAIIHQYQVEFEDQDKEHRRELKKEQKRHDHLLHQAKVENRMNEVALEVGGSFLLLFWL